MIQKESEGVLERHAKKEKNAAYKAGVVIALLLVIPIVITFWVSVSSGGGFGVFWVLTASMLLTGALTVVPLTSSKNKFLRSILIGIFALLLIMYFVDRMNGGGEFIFWSVPTIFGLSVVFLPIIIRKIKLPVALSHNLYHLQSVRRCRRDARRFYRFRRYDERCVECIPYNPVSENKWMGEGGNRDSSYRYMVCVRK